MEFPKNNISQVAKELGNEIKKIDKSEIQPLNQRNDRTLSYWFPKWIRQSYENYSRIKPSESFQKLFYKSKAIVLGAGASLDDNIEKLKKINRGNGNVILFCPNTILSNLVANDIRPDYVVIFDAHPHIADQFDGIDTSDLTMITHTSIHPKVLDRWKGKKYFFNLKHPGHDFFDYILPIVTYPRFPGLPNSGCVVNTTVRIALCMGVKKIYLTGVDFGFTDGKYRCKNYKKDNGEWIEQEFDAEKNTNKINEKFLREKNGIKCWEEHIGYNQTLIFLSQLKQRRENEPIEFELIDCSRGIVSELKKGSLDELIIGGK